MSWIFDATPLIYLAKAHRLDVVATLEGRCLVPEPVYREVVAEGIEAGHTDARRIEHRVEDGSLEVVEVADSPVAARVARNPGLSDADVAVLACANARDAIAVMDESAGRSTADVEGIETRGTAFVVLSAVADGELTPSDGRETIDTMVETGWYVAPDLYAEILAKLDSFEK